VLGRETAIAEIDWHDGWPYLTPAPGGAHFVEGRVQNRPPLSFAPPDTAPNETETERAASTAFSTVYRFDGSETFPGKLNLHPDFKTLREEPSASRYSLTARKGFLRLRGGESPASCYHKTLLARRQTDFSFDVETRMSFSPKRFHEFAGLCYRYDESNQFLFTATFHEEHGTVLFVQTITGKVYKASLPIPVPAAALENGILLGLTVRGCAGRFRYSIDDGKTWQDAGPELDASALSDDRTGGFTGAFIGMICVDLYRYRAVADFEWFSYKPAPSVSSAK
jgi:xylan 1,4-beta-xylosidase